MAEGAAEGRRAEATEFAEMLAALWRFATVASRTKGGLPVLSSQAEALRRISRSPDGLTPTALAEQLDLSRPGVSELIRKLEHAGLAQRHRSEEDGRSVIVTVTEQGRRVQDTFRTGLYDVMTEAFGAMTARDVQRLSATMPVYERLQEQLAAIADRPAVAPAE